MKVSLIVALAENGVIGNCGKIPWYIREDLRRFKKLTTNKAILMGRNTWESLPVKPLSNRRCFVASKTILNGFIDQRFFLCRSVEHGIYDADIYGYEECFIIGGNNIYKEALELGVIDTMYITRVKGNYEGDTYFPESSINWSEWEESEVDCFDDFMFCKYDRII